MAADRRKVDIEESVSGEETREVRFKPSPRIWRYLGWLSRNSLLGETENEVAKNILLQKLTEMRGEDYKDPPNT